MAKVNSYSTERQAIETRFNNMFDTLSVPVQYDNVKGLQGGGDSIENTNRLSYWVRHSIIGADSRQVEVTNERTRIFGLIVVNVFAKEDTGSAKAREIADEIFNIYDGQLFDGIQCQATRLNQTPPFNGWFQLTLTTEYYWDRCK